MQKKPLIHVVESDLPQAEEIRRAFAIDGYEIVVSHRRDEAESALRRRAPDVLIVAAELPDGRGADLMSIQDLKKNATAGVVLVRDSAIQDVVEAMRHGAVDVLEKPVFPGHLAAVVGKALADRRRVRIDADRPPVANHGLSRPPIVGASAPLARLLDSVELVTRAAKATVLIEGESGTGKELIARAIHFDGPRKSRPFLAVNCATLTENLLEAELFGYEKGAFTGALATGKKGLFEAADGGTLFLDEIGEMMPSLQARLLRVLQEGSFKRVGGVDDIQVDVRVIAATNRDLRSEVHEGRFRADLFYRLNVVPVRVPPLRDRREDIPRLCEHFLARFAEELGKQVIGFSKSAEEKLLAYSWPGNVRELRNVCEYATIVCDGDIVESRHLTLPDEESKPVGLDGLQLEDLSLKSMESELIRVVLEETHFNITRAATVLGINRSTLYNKMKDYGLQRSDRPFARQSV